jgi:hypothetical protein
MKLSLQENSVNCQSILLSCYDIVREPEWLLKSHFQVGYKYVQLVRN